VLVGARRLDIVNGFAREKIKEKSLGDPIEVHLYCKMKLKKTLDLPVATEGMLYPAMAGITDNELAVAAKRALDRTSSPEQILEILISSEHWTEKLVQEHPEEFMKIDRELNAEIENVSENNTLTEQAKKDQIDKIQKLRETRRKELVAQLTKAWIQVNIYPS
jgi:C-terminal novel E3 ligase, LRR-interacting